MVEDVHSRPWFRWLAGAVGTLALCRGCEAHGHGHHHTCVHDQVAKQAREHDDPVTAAALRAAAVHLNAPTTREMKAESKASGRSLLQATDAENLRMHAEYQLDDVDPAFAEIIRDQVVPRAIMALSRALMIRAPVQGNLKLPRTCSSVITSTMQCAVIGELCWGDLPQDPPEEFFGDTEVCNGRGCTTEPGGDGIPDADFAVFVSAYPTSACLPTTGAHAVTCSRDEQNWYGLPDRPLVGYINFCPPAVGEHSVDDTKYVDGLVDTATHELIHTLFMSANLYEHYISADGSPLGATISGVVSTPAVRQATRDHFDCPTAEGALLEQDGGGATSGSHWESTTFQSEIMIGASAAVERRVLSPITLALAQDSGWYVPNWDAQGFLRHGHLAGCDMEETCDAVPADSPAQQFYCEPDEPPGCLYHEKSSWCTDTALTDCHILQPLNNGDCKDPQNMLSRLSSNSATEVGIYYGPQAICIGVPNGQLSRGLRTWPINDACVASRCESDGSLSVLIKEVTSDDFKAFPCPEGEEITLGVADGFSPNTKLGPCPPAGEVCPYKGCPVNDDLMCSLQGNCFDGKCFCAVDKSGDDCSQTLCDSDEGCMDGQFCSDAHECTWGTAPPPPPPGTEAVNDNFVTDFGGDFTPMRAVRVGYLQQCVFFDDANGDFAASITLGEKSQPSGPKGEVNLYLEGEAETTSNFIRQDSDDTPCTDSFTDKTEGRILFSMAPGVAIEESTIGPFSTAVSLEMQAGNVSLSQGESQVATAYGLPSAESVHGKDWLQVMTAPADDAERDQAAEVGLVSIATVLSAEQMAAFVAGDDLQSGYNASNAMLRQLTATAGGDVMGKLQDTEWLVDTMQSAAEDASLPAPDATKAQAVADSIVLVNARLVEVKDTVGAGDSEQLLTSWAKAAHVGDVLFADHAAQFGAGDMEETEFKNRTSAQALAEGEAAHDVDLSDATLLEDPSFFDNARESINEWLGDEQMGLFGWVWVAFGAVVLFLLCCVCSYCTTWSKKRKAHKAVRRQLDDQLGTIGGYGHQNQRSTAAPSHGSNGANGQRLPAGWEDNARSPNTLWVPPSQVVHAPPAGSVSSAASSRMPTGWNENPRTASRAGRATSTHSVQSSQPPSRGRAATYDPLAAPAF